MMTPRQAAFREAYRAQIARLYNGPAHVLLIYAIGGATIWYAARQVNAPSWREWCVIPVAFLGCNLFEWFLHAQIMHRPRRGLMGIYRRHTLAHHQFFTAQEPTLDDTRDYRIVFFPPYALITFIAMSAIGAALVDAVWSSNAAWLLICTTAAVYLNYEFFHWCCHVKDDRIVRRIPFVNTIRRHHIAHHDTAIMMDCNMNLTYPIADWVFGTSDLDRGLLGHLFNGYSTKFVRKDLKKTRASADRPLARA
ncbi:MAG: hypothetical protein JO264_02295 [Acidisphaera sp.]|nr:hypothetical protein [Acidisphaera sp.]